MPRLRKAFVTALAALLAPALFALDTQNMQPANSAVPGTLNYIEGSAAINGQPVTQRSIGSAILEPGQVLSTSSGRAEVLLTPGVFLRLGDDSAVQMVSPDLMDTAIHVQRGHAAVEVDQLFPQNHLHVVVDNVPVQILKPGFYEFDAERGAALVFSGEAAVQGGNGHWTTIKGHHALNVSEGATLKPAKFDVDAQEQTGLYQWSSLRSNYLAEANAQIAGEYGAGYAPGWYWNPWMLDYTFLGPWPFYSPFGWGFYPFGWAGGWYGPGFYSRGFHGYAVRGGEIGGFHSGAGLGGFHGGGFGGGRGR